MASVGTEVSGADAGRGATTPWTLAQWVAAGMAAPGGPPMTAELLRALDVSAGDRVIELGPGVGRARAAILALRPRSYLAVDPDPGAAARLGPPRPSPVPKILRRAVPDEPVTRPSVQTAPLDRSGAPDGEASVVVTEGSLGTLPDPLAAAALREAARVLRAGGRLGLHELAVVEDSPGEDEEARVVADLALDDGSGLHARTVEGWRAMVREAGLIVLGATTGPVVTAMPRDLAREIGPRHALRLLPDLARDGGRRGAALGARVAVDRHLPRLRAVVLLAEKPLVLGMRRPRVTGALR